MASRFYCEVCDVTCGRPADWQRHTSTNKHMRAQNNAPQNKTKYLCLDCDYTCCKNSILERHNSSTRHKLRVKSKNDTTLHDSSSMNNESSHILSSQSHCSEITQGESEITRSESEHSRLDYMTIISQLLNQNNELKNFIIEQATEHKNFAIEQANEHKKETMEIVNKVIENTKPINNTNTVNGNVNNTQKFNINVFLNEQCKDAMNLSDFVKSIEVSREDLENNAQLGFVGGISKIFMDNLKQLSINERPIHCTDVKRETMYIKDDDKWTKEVDSTKLNRVIQTITQKSTRTLLDWKKVNPDYNDNDSEFSNLCIVIQRNSMAGYDRDTYYPKVIHAIARETIVTK